MARERGDQYRLELVAETSSFADTSWATPLVTRIIGEPTINGARKQLIDNENSTIYGGDPGKIPGLSEAINDAFQLEHYLEGLGTAAGDSTQATATVLTELMACVVQTAPDLLTGTTATGTPSATSIDEGATDLQPNGTHGIVGVTLDSGDIEWLPYTFSGNTLSLLMAASAAPSSGNVLYGTALMPWTANPSGAVGRSARIRLLGNSDTQNVEFLGCVTDRFSIAEVGPGGVPRLTIGTRGATHNRDVSDTKADGTNDLATVAAGSEVYIAGYGDTTRKSIKAIRVQVTSDRTFEPDDDINEAYGLSGWTPMDSPPSIQITTPLTETPPAAISSSTFEAAVRNNQASGDDLQLQVAWGQGSAGRVAGTYMPRCRLTGWEESTLNGVKTQVLTFTPKDVDEQLIWFQG